MLSVVIAFAIVNSVLLLWILAITRHAWRTLPPGAQFPVHGGPGGWDKWRPKEYALRVWPVVGALVWLVTVAEMIVLIADPGARARGGLAVLPAVLAIPMVIMAVSEHLAASAAARAAGNPGSSA